MNPDWLFRCPLRDRCILALSRWFQSWWLPPLDFMVTLIIYDHGGWKSRGTVERAISMLCCREPGKLYRPSRLLSRCVITLIAACVQLEKESLSLILFQEIRRTRRYRREIESYLDDCLIPGAKPIFFSSSRNISLFFYFSFFLLGSFLFSFSFFFSFPFYFLFFFFDQPYRSCIDIASRNSEKRSAVCLLCTRVSLMARRRFRSRDR